VIRKQFDSKDRAMSKQILCVGNCVPDTRAIATLIESNFDAQVVSVDDLPQTIQKLENASFDLVLVNRVIDQDGSQGIDVVRKIKASPALQNTAVMMITNFLEHQQIAQQAGALPGFGKRELAAPETISKLADVLQGRLKNNFGI
jgi:two-component system chemotaxis response regulator CheY